MLYMWGRLFARLGLGSLLALGACGRVAASDAVDAGAPEPALTIDFSALLPLGGYAVGNFNDPAIAFDVSQPVQRITPTSAANIVLLTELGTTCGGGSLLASHIAQQGLPAGASISVDHIDVTLVSTATHWHADTDPEAAGTDGMCLGYRDATGWHWLPSDSNALQLAKWDAAVQRYKITLLVQHQADAIALVFGAGQSRALDTIVVAAQP